MKLSYAILVKDEIDYIKSLIDLLNKYKTDEDEIVILQDIGESPSEKQIEVKKYLLDQLFNNRISYYSSTVFKNDFSEIKNKLNEKCKGDYIFNIDADEKPSELLLENLKSILLNNPDIDLFMVPRVNTVKGLTPEHAKKWNWVLTETAEFGIIINYPDFQGRIYKNTPSIKWVNKVHEVIFGSKAHTTFPYDTFDYVIFHHKDISRQEKQNEQYSRMLK